MSTQKLEENMGRIDDNKEKYSLLRGWVAERIDQLLDGCTHLRR